MSNYTDVERLTAEVERIKVGYEQQHDALKILGQEVRDRDSRIAELEGALEQVRQAVVPGIRPWLPKTLTEEAVAKTLKEVGIIPLNEDDTPAAGEEVEDE